MGPDGVALASLADFWQWWEERHRATTVTVTRVSLDSLDSWRIDPRTGNIGHDSGRFFTVEGVRTRSGDRTDARPILCQPETGILGFLIHEHAGQPWVLIQAKMEPGNANLLQVSPTVQATWSNYTRVHGGRRTRYLDHFTAPRRQSMVDVDQSEHGYWFWRKRNRNVAVRVDHAVPVTDHHRWLPLDLLRQLVAVENLVNMDARSVLACLPSVLPPHRTGGDLPPFRTALIRSYHHRTGESRSSLREVVAWLANAQRRRGPTAALRPLADLPGWIRTPEEIADERGVRYRIIGVRVESGDREVRQWSQPLLAPCGVGLARLIVRPIDGVLHLLMCARAEAGLVRGVELGPTIRRFPGEAPDSAGLLPCLTDEAPAGGGMTRFDTVLSEEGGRFYHALTRYQVVEVGDAFPLETPPEFRWVTLRQLMVLLRRSFRVSVEARSLLAALHSMW